MPMQPVTMAVISTSSSTKFGNLIARKLLRSQPHTSTRTLREVQHWTQDIMGKTAQERLQQELDARKFNFLSYAGAYWLEHTKSIHSHASSHMNNQFLRIYNSKHAPVSKPWSDWGEDDAMITVKNESANSDSGVLSWAVRNKHFTLIKLLIDSNDDDRQSLLGQSCEWCIKHEGYSDVSKVLIPFMCEAEIVKRWLFRAAVSRRDDEIAEMLLSRSISAFNGKPDDEALRSAAWYGLSRTVRTLLSLEIKTDAIARESLLRYALEGTSNSAVVKLLATQGVDVNAILHTETPLTLATACGNLEAMDLLITMVTQLDNSNVKKKTPLMIAVSKADVYAVQKLLVAGADPQINSDGQLPLVTACHLERPDIVDFLLAAGASPCADDRSGSPLEIAVRNDNWTILNQLFRVESNLGDTDAAFSVLSQACYSGKLTVVDKLLEAGVTPVSLTRRSSCLFEAVKGGQLAVVDRLIRKGVDLNFQCHYSGEVATPLVAAIHRRLPQIFSRLQEAGAQINIDSSSRLFLDAVDDGNVETVHQYVDMGIDLSHLIMSEEWQTIVKLSGRGTAYSTIRGIVEGRLLAIGTTECFGQLEFSF